MTALEEPHMAATAQVYGVDPEQQAARGHGAGPAERVRTPLSVVPAPLPRTGRGVLTLVVVILMTALALVLVTNITISNRQYQMPALRAQQTELAEANELLSQRLGYLEAPQNLAARAAALGMVEPAGTATVDAASGRISGEPAAAGAGDRGTAYVSPPAALDQPLGQADLEGEALPPGRIAGPQLKDPAAEKKAAQDREKARAADADRAERQTGSDESAADDASGQG